MNLSSSLSYCTTDKALYLFREEVDAQLAKVRGRLPGAIKRVRDSQEVVADHTTIQSELLKLKNTSHTCKKDSKFSFIHDPTTNKFSYSKLPTLVGKLTLCKGPKPLLEISKPTFEHLCTSGLSKLSVKHSPAELSELIDHKIEDSEGWKDLFERWLRTDQPVLTKLKDKKAELINLKNGLKSGLYKVTDEKNITEITKIEFIATIDRLINNPATSRYIRQCINIAPLNDNDLHIALSLLDSIEGSPESEVQNERLRAASLLTDSDFATRTLYASGELKSKTSKVLENLNRYEFRPLKSTAPNNTILE